MVKKHGDSDRENLLGPLHGLLFAISSQGHSVPHPPDRIAHTMAFVTPVVDSWRENMEENIIRYKMTDNLFFF